MKFWKRKHQGGSKRPSSPSTMTASSGECRVSFSLGQGASSRTLPVSQENIPHYQKQRLDLMNVRNTSITDEYGTTINNDIVMQRTHLGRRMPLSQGALSSSSALRTDCPTNTRQIFKETREEREASLAKGLAILYGMEYQAKSSLRKMRGDDCNEFNPSASESYGDEISTTETEQNNDADCSSGSWQYKSAHSIRSCPALPVSPTKTMKKVKAFPREDELLQRMGSRW